MRLDPLVAIEFRRIPSGEFLMGSRGGRAYADEEPRQHVRITRPFYLGRFPVTQEQFAVWTTEARVEHANEFKGNPEHPAESLDWYQAVEFCRWLNAARSGELPHGHVATLPTEAEWEYACRAGTNSEFHTGDGDAALREAGWFGEPDGSTHPVGLKAPNDHGLHDMHGNVWEWCWDVWDEHAYATRPDGVADPGAKGRLLEDVGVRRARRGQRDPDDPGRVVRGGSWFNVARRCRSPFRYWWRPGSRNVYLGFRVCLIPGPVTSDRQEPKRTRLETEPGGTPGRSRKARGGRRGQ